MVLKPPSTFVHKFCIILREQTNLSKSERVLELKDQPEKKKDDLNPTDDGEASEESHSASNETQLGLRLDLLVSLDVVKGGRVKANFHKLKG